VFNEAIQSGSFLDFAESHAESFDLDEQFLKKLGKATDFFEGNDYGSNLNIHNLVSDQGLQKYANQSHQAGLHVFILNCFAGRNAVADVQMNELRGQRSRSS